MKVHLLRSNQSPVDPVNLPRGYVPTLKQLQSTPLDNLCEYAGRICYDSLGAEKSRSTVDYFVHIHEVKHTSILEHAVLTFEMTFAKDHYAIDYLLELNNRPGIRVEYGYVLNSGYVLTVTLNARAALELPKNCAALRHAFHKFAPLSVPDIDASFEASLGIEFNCVPPESSHEKYYSFHIEGVSRNLTHELVRHRYEAGISQRSTRYVDESDSAIAWHPLLEGEDIPAEFVTLCRDMYKHYQAKLEQKLIDRGVDKFTARKQSRGAARGFLPSALSTACVFTASLYEWRHILLSRANDAADAEIRLLSYEVYKQLLPYGGVSDMKVSPAKDGVGYVLSV